MSLKGKVALIVGIKDNIGSATAEMMAQEGAKVVIAEQNVSSGQALVDKILAKNGQAIYQRLDITLNGCQQNLIKRIVDEYERLDIAFNNVSVDGDRFPLAQQSEDMVAGIIDVNFNGMWLCLKYQIEQMLKNGGGAIVNNVCNLDKNGLRGCSIYQATKSAVASLSQVAALEYAPHNIRINTITPGLIERSPDSLKQEGDRFLNNLDNLNRVPLNRYATAREIANTVTWLCSDQASYITGQNFSVDGGLSIK